MRYLRVSGREGFEIVWALRGKTLTVTLPKSGGSLASVTNNESFRSAMLRRTM